MLIIEVKKHDNIERALKSLKSKVIKTKQQQILLERKEFKKDSVRNREKLLKAKYTQKKRND